MQECLDKYVQTEELKGYKCEKCSQETDASKQFGFSRLSSVLVVHLCRYTYDCSGQSSVKVSLLNTACVCDSCAQHIYHCSGRLSERCCLSLGAASSNMLGCNNHMPTYCLHEACVSIMLEALDADQNVKVAPIVQLLMHVFTRSDAVLVCRMCGQSAWETVFWT